MREFKPKYCKHCGKLLERKYYPDCGKWESTSVFDKRKFCNRDCLHDYGKTHRRKDERLYSVYRNMKNRCENKNNKAFKWYGGKGIKVCDEWNGEQGYENFKKWALSTGYLPSLTLDRIDSDGNYEPNNCRWASWKTQQNNRSNNRFITFDGETLSISEWAERLGTTYGTLKTRINLGWNIEDVLTKPIRKDQRIDLTGERYGRLTAIKIVEKPINRKQKGIYWLCKCSCGNEFITTSNNLRTGNTKSCGCLGREKLIERNNAVRKNHEIKGA